MRKFKALLAGLAVLASSLVGHVATASHAGAANLIYSEDHWSNGKAYSIHWHIDYFDDANTHINMDCYQGQYVWYSCLESWSNGTYVNLSVHVGTPGVTPFEVWLESVHYPGYVYKNYPVNYASNNPPTYGTFDPINYPQIVNYAYNEVRSDGPHPNGAVMNLHRPMIWHNMTVGSNPAIAFTEG